MKKKRLFFNYIILTFICQFFLCFLANQNTVSAANVNNFYFDKFEADYYVEKDGDNVSKMRVVENLTAVFPDYEQNKGICRRIPYTANGGKSRTIDDLNENNITVLRNGVEEPIYSIKSDSKEYEVCTGNDDYVMGRQVYTFEYSFSNVILEPNDKPKGWQELYWDTNGNGWSQYFNILTVRVHFGKDIEYYDDTSCYVGKNGAKGMERCTTTKTSDGFTFTTDRVKSYENLTFNIRFKNNTFDVLPPEKSYVMIVILIIVLLICFFCLRKPIKKFRNTKSKRQLYKGYFVKPEYEPSKDYSLAELSAIYLGKQKDYKVGVLLKLIIEKKIQLREDGKTLFGTKRWKLAIESIRGLDESEMLILQILNNGDEVKDGDVIKIKNNNTTTELITLGKKLDNSGIEVAKKDGLVTSKFNKYDIENGSTTISTFLIVFTALAFIFPILFAIFESILDNETVVISGGEFLKNHIVSGREFVFFDGAAIIILLSSVITIVTLLVIMPQNRKFYKRTEKGLEESRRLDGLKLYIEKAEKDRIAYLQSVTGAEVTPEGIVKLYEKLLPYAALFGLEKTWMAEFSKYCEINGIDSPAWCDGISDATSFAAFNNALHDTSNFVTSSSHYESSSSGSSGSGGSGSSGGGGGGGGGGGR